MTTPTVPTTPPRLTSLAHGGGCGCKVSPQVLADILRTSGRFPVPPELLVGMDTADDAAVYRLNATQALVATTDFFTPIVDDPHDFGRIAATNAISDVYAMGGRPILALAIVGMPVAVLPAEVIGRILLGGATVCAEAGIPVAGGHTIDTAEPIYGLVVLGLVHPDRIQRNSGARPGDVLVLGKPIGVGVLSAALKKGVLDDAGYRRLVDTATRRNTPGIALSGFDGVHALTDVTGFGLGGHLLEMARGAGRALELDWRSVPVLDGVQALIGRGAITGASARNWAAYRASVVLPPDGWWTEADQALLCDPQTSGGLLVACTPDAVDAVLAVFRDEGFDAAAVIGRVTPDRVASLRIR